MIRSHWLPVLASFLLLPGLPTALSYSFMPPGPVPAWTADGATLGLYEFTRDAVEGRSLPDGAKKAPAGQLTGAWKFVEAAELAPGFHGAGEVMAAAAPVRSEAVFRGLSLPAEGFRIDMLLRWNRSGGRFLRVGDVAKKTALVLGIRFRGPGELELQVPVKDAGGAVRKETLSSRELYHGGKVEPANFTDFTTCSLSYDGQKTFAVYLDGQKVFEGGPEGEVVVDGSVVAVGDVADWASPFQGAIAAVRVSAGGRSPAVSAGGAAAFSREAGAAGWTFDAGGAESPVGAGTIAALNTDLYTKERGYGWLQAPKAAFDSWYSPGRYQPDPQAAFKAGTYKIHSSIIRDGVIVPHGDIFRADVPNGEYWVAVGLGNSFGGETIVTDLSANGVTLGTDLRMRGNVYEGHIPQRVARGIVRVKDGKLVLSAKAEGSNLPVESIAILPYSPLPVAWQDRRLALRGQGAAPASLDRISDLLAQDDLTGAVKLAEGITDPLVQANVLACALGRPKFPQESDLRIAGRIRQLLLGVLQREPANTTARWLFDSTERFRHALTGYLDESGDDVVYGTKGLVRYHVANQGLAMRPEDPEYWQGKFLAAAGIWQNGVQASAFGETSDEYVELKKDRLTGFPAPGRYFREVNAAWPDFRISRIMLGEKLPIASDWKAPENAPEWAVLQYQLQQRILDVIHYWVNERQLPSGLLGGGLGDDVEALRWWGSSVTLADDQATIEGWKKLAEAAWKSTKGKGYALTLQDVEHSSEDTSDSQPFLAFLAHGTPQMEGVLERLTKTQPVFRDIWTMATPEGYRMFHGHFLSATEVAREGDVPYNIRAVRPLLWAAWISQGSNKELDEMIIAYARSWSDATMREFDTKPAGIVPMMILPDRQHAKKDEPDGHLNAPTSWVFPGYWSFFYPAGYAEKVYDLLLAGYELSGDTSILEPIRSGLSALRKVPEGDMDAAKYPEGSFDWAIRTGARMIGQAGANYRLLTGDTSYDDVLARIAPAHCRFTILAAQAKTPEEFARAQQPVIEKLKTDLGEMNTNPELRTTIIESTDRIYVCGSLIIDAMSTGLATSDKDLRGGEIVWPNYQVTWKGTQGQIAALVKNATPTHLDVLLYNFSGKALDIRPHFWRLEPGAYQLTLTQTDQSGFLSVKPLDARTVTIKGAGGAITIAVPAGVPLRMELARSPATAGAR